MSDPYRKPDARNDAEPTANPARPWELRTWTSERPCPVCNVAMFAAEKDGYRIDACGQCGGSWMAHAHAKKMIDAGAKAPVELARLTDSIVARPATGGERLCPDCRQPLAHDVVAGVDIDLCDDHGTWFDPRELEQVALALVRDYGPAARQAARDVERAAKGPDHSVSVKNVAIGVAGLSLALIGAAVGSPGLETDIMGNTIPSRDPDDP